MAWLALTFGLVAASLEPTQRAMLADQLAPRWVLVAAAWVLGLFSIAAVLRGLFRLYISAPARLLEQGRVLLLSTTAAPLQHQGTPETQALADVLYEIASQRDALRAHVQEQVALASSRVQLENSRLAALMAELPQSVVVCNLDGRIILYNNRARLQFKALLQGQALSGGLELVGIGRSIYAALDSRLIAHALDKVRRRLDRGAVHPATQFVTTTQAGQLLKVQLAPVRAVQAGDNAGTVSGFVLVLENVTKAFEEEHVRDQFLHRIADSSSRAWAAAQAALDRASLPEVEASERDQCMAQVRNEMGRVGESVAELAASSAQGVQGRWPLEEMLGLDLLLAAQRRIELRCARSVGIESIDDALWLQVDSFSLTQALEYLVLRLIDEFEVQFIRLRLQPAGDRAQLDIIWVGHNVSTETVTGWDLDSMRLGSEVTPLTVRDVVARHRGQMWFERERIRHESFFRFSLPMAAAAEPQELSSLSPTDSRPEYYDFDLFQFSLSSAALEDQRLCDLQYTVFDTETTGLRPAEGDQIIQIGAVRIVNNKLLAQESFDQLVDPRRLIPASTVKIHGITQDMVAGKPAIGPVLQSFQAFAKDTVLVAHNAAFDMRFLELQERETGIVFGQPVLDTLLLSAVVHPNQESHRLEAIAQRFNIEVHGRHTALGDAMVTAKVWLCLIGLLQRMGIDTLKQAREAAQKTYYARLKY
jgi:DNA polymerase-3 subunit epsilon